jgi:hypothetical protein
MKDLLTTILSAAIAGMLIRAIWLAYKYFKSKHENSEHNKSYLSGKLAFRNLEDENDNPYPEGHARLRWHKGWNDAKKERRKLEKKL